MEYLDNEKIILMGMRIKKLRKEKYISQNQLAEILGISVDQMSNIETGKSVCKPDYLYILAQLCSISTDYVFFGEITYKKEESIEEKIINLLSTIDDNCKEKIFNLIMLVLDIKVA